MFSFCYKLSKRFIASRFGALYYLKTTAVLSILQLVGSLSLTEKSFVWGRELFCSGLSTGILSVGFYLLIRKVQKDFKM